MRLRLVTGKSFDVRIAPAADPSVLEQLLGEYLEELLGFTRVGYPGLSCYWSDAHRHPFLILARGRPGGFALVRDVDAGAIHEMAEFYVVPALRRHGVGRSAAALLFARFGGRWQLQFAMANVNARTFWQSVVPAPMETPNANGLVHTMTWTCPTGCGASEA